MTKKEVSLSGWQGIESAPRDRGILGYWPRRDGNSGGHIDLIWWDHEFSPTEWNEDEGRMDYRGAWTAGRVQSWGYEEYQEESPTHWMPLPPPPQP